jgi:hypothetical protein
MAITEIKIDTIGRFAKRKVFGAAGAYMRIKGIAKGEIDPSSPENHFIVDCGQPRGWHVRVPHARFRGVASGSFSAPLSRTGYE